MDENELANQLMYSSPFEIFIVTWDNKLIKLICPFPVIAKHSVGLLKKNERVLVSEVKVTPELISIFIIENFAYYYYYFDFDI